MGAYSQGTFRTLLQWCSESCLVKKIFRVRVVVGTMGREWLIEAFIYFRTSPEFAIRQRKQDADPRQDVTY